mmetsp:Transcript_19644/g.34951  ORF Transcript_19644/g.34951 Transcript_19644/m.34951 type:complete len:438 (-) Transcript_19644:261-1574(-)
MEARLDGALLVGRNAGSRSGSGQFLLSSARSCVLNGDVVAAGGEEPVVAADSYNQARNEKVVQEQHRQQQERLEQQRQQQQQRLDQLEEADGSLEGGLDIGAGSSEEGAPESIDLAEGGSSAVSDVGSECATTGVAVSTSSIGTRDEDAVSVLSEMMLDETAMRKRNYIALTEWNEERSIETMLVQLSGGLVISSTMERIGAAFCSDGQWPAVVAVARQESTQGEWLISGFAIGTDEEGRRSTIWRGKCLGPNYDPAGGMEWFSLGAVDPEISVCVRAPESWDYKVYFGQFPDPNVPAEEQEEDDEDYETSPQYVLSVPGNTHIHTLISFELLNDINYIEGTKLDVYAVDGHDYEACDDPRVFWTEEFRLATCKPACRKSSLTGLQLKLDSELVYMLVLNCPLPLQFCLRVASEYALDIFDFVDDSSGSDSEVGPYY